MTRLDMARVIHSLATNPVEEDLPNRDAWPRIARLLVARGDDWPAARHLAAMTTTSQPAITDAVARLARQTGREVGGLPTLSFWDAVCGLVARSWQLGLLNETDAMYRMDGLWWLIRDLDRSTCQGLQIIWQGMGLTEVAGFHDVSTEAVALLTEAGRLIPATVTDGPLCTAVLDAIY